MTGHVRHPSPLNQFYRLDYDEVRHTWTKTTRWNNVRVVNGRTVNLDSANCMATEGAVAIDADSNGLIRSTPPAIRNAQDDLVGGIGVDDVDVAWHRLWGRDLVIPSAFDWNDVVAAVHDRRHVVIGVDYSKVPYDYQLQKGGTFDHALGLDDWQSDGDMLRYDSLGVAPAWVPQSAVRYAAEALALRVRGTRSSLFVGLTRARPSVTQLYEIRVDPRTWFEYRFVGGELRRRSRDTGGFTARCTAPTKVHDATHDRDVRLVKLTSGVYGGVGIHVDADEYGNHLRTL